MKTRAELVELAECRGRDQELVRAVGRYGGARIEQLQAALGAGRTVTYQRVADCSQAGLLERLVIPGAGGAVIRATREGLRYGGLGLPMAKLSPGNVAHTLRCTDMAIFLGERFGHEAILTEREIAFAEAIEGEAIASAVVGSLPNGKPRLHRADLGLLTDEGVIAVEVELTPKAPVRLRAIIRGWVDAIGNGTVAEVHYLCAPGQTRRAVTRAVEQLRAQACIQIVEVAAHG